MSYTQPPAQPYGTPQHQGGYPQPPQPPKKKRSVGRIIAYTVGFGVLLMFAGCAAFFATAAHEVAKNGVPTVAAPAPTGGSAHKGGSQDDVTAFKAYVTAHGSAQDQAAASHVRLIQMNDGPMPSTDVQTTFAGDIGSADGDAANLVVAMFKQWHHSSTGQGLLTIYNSSGSMLANGNY